MRGSVLAHVSKARGGHAPYCSSHGGDRARLRRMLPCRGSNWNCPEEMSEEVQRHASRCTMSHSPLRPSVRGQRAKLVYRCASILGAKVGARGLCMRWALAVRSSNLRVCQVRRCAWQRTQLVQFCLRMLMRGDDRERLANGAPICCCCMTDTELTDGERSVEAMSNAGRTVARACAAMRACRVKRCVRTELARAAGVHLRKHGAIVGVRQHRRKKTLPCLWNAARQVRSSAPAWVQLCYVICLPCTMSHACGALCHTRAVHYVTCNTTARRNEKNVLRNGITLCLLMRMMRKLNGGGFMVAAAASVSELLTLDLRSCERGVGRGVWTCLNRMSSAEMDL